MANGVQPKSLEWLDVDLIPQSGQDIVHLKLKLNGQSGVEKYQISQREFVHWLQDQISKFGLTSDDRLIRVLGEIRDNIGNLSCHYPPQGEGKE